MADLSVFFIRLVPGVQRYIDAEKQKVREADLLCQFQVFYCFTVYSEHIFVFRFFVVWIGVDVDVECESAIVS